jgi:hypothetical protein
MRTLSAKAKIKGLTLIEVLVVIGVVFILAAMLLPTLNHSGPSRGIQCISKQKQIAVGFIMWHEDNGGQFPWQVMPQMAVRWKLRPEVMLRQIFNVFQIICASRTFLFARQILNEFGRRISPNSEIKIPVILSLLMRAQMRQTVF